MENFVEKLLAEEANEGPIDLSGLPPFLRAIGEAELDRRNAVITMRTAIAQAEDFRAGFADTIGRRKSMEDAMVILPNFLGSSDTPSSHYFAVFDGHNSRHAADFAASELHGILAECLKNRRSEDAECVREALRLSFQLLSAELKARNIKGGTTALVVIVVDGEVYCANAGDSHCVAVIRERERWKGKRITEDHRPSEVKERERILSCGGKIMGGRLGGVLGVSRGFGNLEFPSFSPEPYITGPLDDSCYILACDGLWDFVSDDEVAALVGPAMLGELDKDPGWMVASGAARAALEAASAAFSNDNISIIVVDFNCSGVE